MAELPLANQRSKWAGKIYSLSSANQQSISVDGIALFVHSAIPRSKDPVLLLPRSAQSASYFLGLTTTLSRSSSVTLHILYTINQLKNRGWSYIMEILRSRCLISFSTTIFHDCHCTSTSIYWYPLGGSEIYCTVLLQCMCLGMQRQVTIQSQCVSLPFL